jgi:hypothetical protein
MFFTSVLKAVEMKLANKRTRAVGVSNDQINSPGFAKPQFQGRRRVHQHRLRIWEKDICDPAALKIESRNSLATVTFRASDCVDLTLCELEMTTRLRRRLARTVPGFRQGSYLSSTEVLVDDSLRVRGYIIRFSATPAERLCLIVKLDAAFRPREYEHLEYKQLETVHTDFYTSALETLANARKHLKTMPIDSPITGPFFFGGLWPKHPPFDGLITDGSDNQPPVDPELIEQLSRLGENPRLLWIPRPVSTEGDDDVDTPMLVGEAKPTNLVAAEVQRMIDSVTADRPNLLRIVGGCSDISDSTPRGSHLINLFIGHDVQQDFGPPGEIPISDASIRAECWEFLRLWSRCSRNTLATTEPQPPLPTDPTDPPAT